MSSITNAPGAIQKTIVWQIAYCNGECETKSEGCGIVREKLNYGVLRVFIAFGNHTGPLFIWRSEVPYGIVFNKHICYWNEAMLHKLCSGILKKEGEVNWF